MLAAVSVVSMAAIGLVACGGHGMTPVAARAGAGGPAAAGSGAAGLAAAGSGAGGSAAAGSAVGSSAGASPADWPEFDYNPQRSGIGPASTGITAGDLASLQTRVVHVDGTVDSSAVELSGIAIGGRARDVIVVTTSYGKTIAIDPGTGQRLWEYTPRDFGSYVGREQVTTATPVVDPDRRYVYSASPNGFVHKLAIATGQLVWARRVTFDASKEKIAAALNISPGPARGRPGSARGRASGAGAIVVTTGGYYGDAPTYQGHVVMIDRASGRILHVWNALCSNRHHLIDPPSSCPASDAAIWARAGAVVEPGSGRILVATGNAPFNGATNWGDSVLELSPDAGALLHNWTPTDQAQLNSNDNDLGSTAPALLPPLGGYRLAVQGGKDGRIRLLDLGRLNGTRGGAGSRTGGELEDIGAPGGAPVFTAPAVWTGGGLGSGTHQGHAYGAHRGRPYVFVATSSGTAAYTVQIGRHPHLVTAWSNGNGGTSPVLAGGLLYVYDPGGSLDVYQPTSGRLLRSLPAAPGHWNSPIVAGGRIIEPVGNYMDHATSGEIFIWHLPGR